MTEEFEVDGIHVEIFQEEYVGDPRKEFDHLATMVCANGRYILGDEQMNANSDTGRYPNPYEWIANQEGLKLWCKTCEQSLYDENWHDNEEEIDHEPVAYFKDNVFILPLYLMDHSGISMSTSKSMFSMVDSAGWDWGCVGFIYITEKKMLDAFDPESDWFKEYHEGKTIEQVAIDVMVSEVEEYDQYLTGDVYGYTVAKGSPHEESCGWLYGYDYAVKEATEMAQLIAKEVAKNLVSEHMD